MAGMGEGSEGEGEGDCTGGSSDGGESLFTYQSGNTNKSDDTGLHVAEM